MFRRFSALVILALVAACSADSTIPPSSFDVALALDSIAMRAGDSMLPTVNVTVDGVTRAANAREILVSSSDTSVITIAPNGALLAVGRGQSNITVAWAATSSIRASQPVSVVSETLTGVSLVAPLNMVPGDTTIFSVTGTIRGGRKLASPSSVEVTSRNTAVVKASGNQAIAVAPGTTWIVARASSGVSDSAFVTVAVGMPAHLAISPKISSLVAGQSLQTTVTMSDRRYNAVTAIVPDYISTAPSIASVQPNGNVTAASAGSALIIARAGTIADTLQLTVTAAPLARITVTPDSVQLAPGASAQIQVQGFDAQNRAMSPGTLTWQSLTSGIIVSSTGVITASSSITTAINNGAVKVTSGAFSTQVRVVVTPAAPAAPVLARLILSPDSVTLAPGGATVVTVQAIDTRGGVMALPALTWQSQTAGVSASGSGVIQASATIGTTIPNGVVIVSSGAVSAQLRVAVVVPTAPVPVADNGYVQIRWIGDTPSPAVAAAFETARLRLNTIFNSFNGVAPIALNVGAGTCLGGEPAFNETIKGLLIYAQVTAIDGAGSILGSAGPCYLRNNTWLPMMGAMQFDVADMASMAANGTLNGVVLHEMMHVLGFGSIWGPGFKGEVASPTGTDPRFIGTNAQAGYAAVGGTDGATGVPVENTGGSGTQGAHWRESVMHSELMTGWADGSLAMSRATIGALRDFGYDVDMNKADAFSLGSSLRSSASLVVSVPIKERTFKPVGVVGGDGRVVPYTGN